VLTGQNRDLRVERALRWHAMNVTDSNRAMADKEIPGFRALPERWVLLDEVADARKLGRGYRKGYTSTEAVKAAEVAFPNLGPWSSVPVAALLRIRARSPMGIPRRDRARRDGRR
jgi:hypothetical protein